MKNLFIIPQARQSIIAKIEQGEIIPVAKIDLPYNSKSIITDNNFIVSLCFNEKELRIHDISGNHIHTIENLSYKAINFQNNVVYLGGECNGSLHRKYKGEIFSILDLNNQSFEIQKFDLPIEPINGKSIDDILIRDNTLILVDNCIYPKYIIYYDITEPSNPVYKESTRLPRNGTYEHIVKGDISDDSMVLFSSTVGQFGSAQHIIVSGKYNLRLSAHQSAQSSNSHISIGRLKIYVEGVYYHDICLVDDNLLIIRDNELRCIKLKRFSLFPISKRIEIKMSVLDRIIKAPSNQPIVICERGYQLLLKNKNKWSAKWDLSTFWGAD